MEEIYETEVSYVRGLDALVNVAFYHRFLRIIII